MLHHIVDIFRQSVMISGFVMVMMLIVEYLTIQTKGQWSHPFQQRPGMQLLLALLLGLSPGCLGGFAVVTLYTHRVINFPALVAAMIATSGDEAFLMFSMIPGQALQIHAYLFVIALVAGLLTSLFMRKVNFVKLPHNHLQYHANEPQCYCFNSGKLIPQLRQPSFTRVLLIFIGLLFMYMLFSGHDHDHEGSGHLEQFFFVALNLVYLFIVSTVPEHFLREHLWEHTIKRHLPKIFLWTFGAFLFIHLSEHYFNLSQWVENHMAWVLLVAVLVGLIPESGPHIIFISLFAQGAIPMSILIANSIVQDGHSALPLLAESPRSFVWVKVVNLLVGLLVGGTMWYFGF